jgi:hypothetical protein
MVRGFELLDAVLGMPVPLKPLWSIVDVRFGSMQSWQLELRLEREATQLVVTFRDVISFRAHDESEITGHWAAREDEQVAVGSVYRIDASTYRDEFLESTAALAGQQLTHYLIAGFDLCVEVLASSLPEMMLKDE